MSVKPTLQEQLQNNLGGNLNNKFGMTLPVPFIENITIDAAGKNITVKAAMYFNMDDYGDLNFGDFIGSLEDLNFYAMLAFNREYTATTGSEMTSDNHLMELINGDVDILSQLAQSWSYTAGTSGEFISYYPGYASNTAGSINNIYSFEPISDWDEVDTYYNNAGQPIKKLSKVLTIPVSDWWTAGQADNFLNYIENPIDYDKISDVGFLTFSSPLQLTGLPDKLWKDIDDQNINDPNNPMIDFYSSMTSDINSFVFFKDGSIALPDQTIFVTGDGTIVEEPIMGLDLRYHYSDKLTIPILIDYFRPLTGTSEDNTLQTMLDSLSTILETSGNDPQLLVKINAFLQSFADKSSATAIGQFYGRVLQRLTKANTAVIKGPIASKQLINNPTVIDLRGTSETSTYEPPEDSPIDGHDFIFANSFYVNRRTGMYEEENYTVDQGSFFFDYDSLLKEKSRLAQYLDVQKVEDLFGSEVLCNRFYIENISMSPMKKYKTNGNVNHRAVSVVEAQFSETDYNIPTQTIEVIVDDTDYYPINSPLGATYLYLRNFNLMNEVGEAGLNTFNNGRFYKLMCFQFQNVLKDLSEFAAYYYKIEVDMRDSTDYIYVELYDLALETKELLQEYYVLASEACSYNETDDFFNQFFIRGVEARYSENPSDAPWIKAAFIYTYLEDLWDNSHGGDQDEILSQAKNLSATVGPNGGTLEALKSLVENYNTLMGNLFKETIVSNLKSALENYEDENDGYYYEEVNVEVNQNPYNLGDPVELDWDAIVVEEVVVTDWERHNNYVQYDFGKNFNTNGDDEDNLWSALKSKDNQSLWPFGNSAAGWDKEGHVFQSYIRSFVEDHDAHLLTGIYYRFTYPVQDPEDESTYITYLVAVQESEGLVKIRPYTRQAESPADAQPGPNGVVIGTDDSTHTGTPTTGLDVY
jgi:hypothetical protein